MPEDITMALEILEGLSQSRTQRITEYLENNRTEGPQGISSL
jgi:hypothetical protein